MAYTTNPHLPRLRMEAVRMVESGAGIRETARHFGYSPGAVFAWVKKAESHSYKMLIPTKSSRPFSHPKKLSSEKVLAILEYRRKYHRCAEVLQFLLKRDGIDISLSSVKRTLKRNHLTYPSPWKKWHKYPPRPIPEKPGILVEIDTIHDGPHEDRLYAYTLIDVCSRWAFAIPSEKINTHRSLSFVRQAELASPFRFQTLQSDHGPEFSKWFTKKILEKEMSHRHSRVRKPNDNAHLERFNRTIQDECLNRVPRSLKYWKKEIPEYLNWYNNQRPHMRLGMRTPMEVFRSY